MQLLVSVRVHTTTTSICSMQWYAVVIHTLMYCCSVLYCTFHEGYVATAAASTSTTVVVSYCYARGEFHASSLGCCVCSKLAHKKRLVF
jgi:hypothetical protein